MDKKIFSAAFLALILEVLWLLADMRVINIPGITEVVLSKERQQIGSVEQRRHTLKRKFLDSIVWEDTTANDPLFYLDSVLTLDQSSATLRLTGDTQLTLSENTLVVLEPTSNEKTDQIRVRFSRGDIRSRNPDKKIAVESASWTVEVEKGSEVSLRTKDSENLELEVHKGKVKVKEETQQSAVEFESGDVVKMHNTEVEHQKIDNDLIWLTPIENLSLIRKYSHHFPVPVKLEWKGAATELTWEDPLGKTQKIQLENGVQSHEIHLEKGLHHFRVGDGATISTALPVEIWKAPEIYTFWPLPRDRYVSGKEISFSWSETEDITTYQLNIFSGSVSAYSKRINNRSTASEAPPIEGEYEWSVEAFDTYGFPIPHYYRSPIYFLNNPLAPPVLREPEILDNSPPPLRAPAKDSSSWLFRLFINEAQADVKSASGYKALFKWENVKGADHYIIEIDDEPNFKTPLVQKTITSPEFLWSDFKLSTYYWRVAAEGKNGEKGLFSSVTSIDLTNPKVFSPPPEPIVEAPVPSTAPAPEPVKSVAKEVVPKPPKPETLPKSDKPKPVVNTPPPSKEKSEEPEFLSKEKFDDGGRPIKGYVFLTPVYESAKGQGNDITTSFSGFQFTAIDSRVDFPIDANDTDITLQLGYRGAEYKALPEQDFPFQERIRRGNLRGSLLYGPSREMKYGLRSSTFEIIKRKSYEQVRAEDSIAYGPTFLWPIMEDLEFQGALMLGSSTLLGEIQIRYLYAFPIVGSMNIRWGAEMEYRLVNTPEYRETQVLPKLIFGISW